MQHNATQSTACSDVPQGNHHSVAQRRNGCRSLKDLATTHFQNKVPSDLCSSLKLAENHSAWLISKLLFHKPLLLNIQFPFPFADPNMHIPTTATILAITLAQTTAAPAPLSVADLNPTPIRCMYPARILIPFSSQSKIQVQYNSNKPFPIVCTTNADCPNNLWRCSLSDNLCHFHLKARGRVEETAYPFCQSTHIRFLQNISKLFWLHLK